MEETALGEISTKSASCSSASFKACAIGYTPIQYHLPQYVLLWREIVR